MNYIILLLITSFVLWISLNLFITKLSEKKFQKSLKVGDLVAIMEAGEYINVYVEVVYENSVVCRASKSSRPYCRSKKRVFKPIKY